MAKERTDTLVKFRANDVLEFAGLRIGFGIGDRKRIGEKALCQTTAADDVASAALPAIGQPHLGILHIHKAHNRQTLDRALWVRIERMEARQFGAPSDFLAKPQLFQNVIETSFVFGRVNGDLR